MAPGLNQPIRPSSSPTNSACPLWHFLSPFVPSSTWSMISTRIYGTCSRVGCNLVTGRFARFHGTCGPTVGIANGRAHAMGTLLPGGSWLAGSSIPMTGRAPPMGTPSTNVPGQPEWSSSRRLPRSCLS